ncbi:hypothetical protein VHEMI10420 [[Torrubiella] hemipterigena]|uniref:FAD-binding FR-type domain-containing protein n=1 Tax=[Torrubiella] hemipterigena TaxID=1531966 RepID=A0A0A1TT86_9HYPO|nr:hypothetical protein VHEMI10420 [[Torrubiella] hemipterigena]
MDFFTKRHIQDHSLDSNVTRHWGYADRQVPCKNDPGSCAYLDIAYDAHDSSMLYVGILWSTIGAILLIWWLARLAAQPTVIPAPRHAPPSTLRRIANTASALKNKILLPDANHFLFGRTTRLQVAVLAILTGYVIIWSFVGIVYGTWITPVKNMPGVFNIRTSLGPWSNRIGVLAYALTPLSVLLSTRESLLTVVTGVPYQNFNFLHRWLGYIIFAQASLHTIAWCVVQLRLYQPQPSVSLVWIQQGYIIWGIVATILILIMVILSTPWGIRATGYEFFRKAHYVLAMVYLGACWAHWNKLECFIVPAFIVWGIDRGARLFRSTLLHYHPTAVKPGFSPAQAQVSLFEDNEDGDVVRLDMENPQDAWSVGQHFYLTFTDSSIWQSHPFTPFSVPVVKDGVVKHSYIFRAKGGETKKVAQLARKKTEQSPPSAATTGVVLTGPYGEDLLSKIDADTNVVCVAGGTGITYVLPLLLQLARQAPVADRKIEFVWAIRHASNLNWVRDEIEVLRRFQSTLNLTIHFCITRDAKIGSLQDKAVSSGSSSEGECPCEKTAVKTTETEEDLSLGRPDLNKIIGDFVQNTISARTVVFASGPGGMITDLRRAVANTVEPAKVWRGEQRFSVDLVCDDRLEW